MILFAALTLGYTSCDYLDVVPKSKATENDIWKTPAEAKKFRFNMMQYMPVLFSYTKSPDQFAGDDFMSGSRSTSYWFPGKSLHYNEENPSQTYFGYWAPVARTNGTNYDLSEASGTRITSSTIFITSKGWTHRPPQGTRARHGS